MGYPTYADNDRSLIEQAGANARAISLWIDESEANAARDPEARTWGRIAKLGEESGEVIDAMIGATGQNPRKGVYGSMDDVLKETFDTMSAALCLAEHLTGNRGIAMGLFVDFMASVRKRADETPIPGEKAERMATMIASSTGDPQ